MKILSIILDILNLFKPLDGEPGLRWFIRSCLMILTMAMLLCICFVLK